MKSWREITNLCRKHLDAGLSDSARLKMQTALDEELAKVAQAPPKPVLTIEEVALYLRVTPEIIGESLGDLPCFELGGKLLFRKDSVDEWIKMKEENFTRDVYATNVKKLNIA
jgi:hypothetical protein